MLTAQAGMLPHTLLCILHSLPGHIIFFSSVKNDLSPLSACAQLASLVEAGRSCVQQTFQYCERIPFTHLYAQYLTGTTQREQAISLFST